jgi:hypothetical protein
MEMEIGKSEEDWFMNNDENKDQSQDEDKGRICHDSATTPLTPAAPSKVQSRMNSSSNLPTRPI